MIVKMKRTRLIVIGMVVAIISGWLIMTANAQQVVHYTGTTLSNVDYHHGQLRPAIGVHNIQVMRANRAHPETADGFGWTYNHAPMLAYWNNTFYLQYLSNPVGEHVPPGQTLMVTSSDGIHWSKSTVIFPPYKIPDGTAKPGRPGVAKDLFAVMHQRMGFYTSKKNRLLTLAYYGIAMDAKDDPNDGNGIGRVVREVLPDGTYGPIYFIRYNASWDQKRSTYPFYTKSKDRGFIEACNELLANPLMMMQWVEEADRDDALIPLKKQYKAFCYYHLPDGRVVGLWKHALTAISVDGGKNWSGDAVRAPGFVNSNAKIWGQRTFDGRYATVYNPSEYRWPLAVSTSDDGLNYTDLLLVQGEITPMRYGGNYKSYGPQYVRGIPEGDGVPPDHNLWVTYSMNKEDIWVASIPVPVKATTSGHVNDVFAQIPAGKELEQWNIYSPVWASVSIDKASDGSKQLVLKDSDPYDHAKAERIIPASKKLHAEFSVTPQQADKGMLHIEFQDAKGSPAIRLVFGADSSLQAKAGARFKKLTSYKAGETYTIRVTLNTEARSYTLQVNGKDEGSYIFYAPVAAVERIVFRTGEPRNFPNPETPADQTYDLPNPGEAGPEATFQIGYLKTSDF